MRLAEDAVIRRMDFGRECDEYMKKFTERRTGITKLERELIVKRYMSIEEPRDYDVYNEMRISESTFYRIREKAFYKLAFALRIEVYKEEHP
ncbi:hypothetical protein GEPA3_2901 [Geobacillus sp. PA-3]|uniref:ArpU family phage packaging/lysis transcriptional regulator n=1 Tax=Geobacillus sp. PA-3 TaxID=1699078 RepID=UPI0006E6AA50|nr:ArpU family phage packaging/lysis transcriptional regulator [Geobacillus sp. PA-3]KQB92121.1 hypothetical protein GEPA3_2901 [Geobacillus sp. PA-3]